MNVTFHDIPVPEELRIVLISDNDAVEDLVSESCPPPNEVIRYLLRPVLDEKGFVTERLEQAMSDVRRSDAVVIEWSIRQAPSIGVVSHHVRTLPPPLIAICCNDPEEQAAALVTGVDDVWPHPLSQSLLRAKILAHLRALKPAPPGDTAAAAGMPPERHLQRAGAIAVDRQAHRVFVRDQEIRLTPRQFALVAYLIENPDELKTREQILENVWGIDFDIGTNVVDVYIHFVRRLLDANDVDASIETVRGKGYRFRVAPL